MIQISAYWRCQILGWSIFTLFQCGLWFLLNRFQWSMLDYMLSANLVGFICSHLLRGFIHRFQLKTYPVGRLILVLLAILPLPVITATAFSFLLSNFLGDQTLDQVTLQMFLQISLNWALVFLSWLTIYFSVAFFKRYQAAEVEQWKMKAILNDAELQALRTQINPHFMFNCLTSACALTIEDPPKAQVVLTQLSDLLRYALAAGETPTVPLDQELIITRKYLALETTRLEDRLHFRIQVDDASRSWQIPAMTLQMLTENAIKHGVAPLPEGGELEISAQVQNGQLHISIGNSGNLQPSDQPGQGVGLHNIAERLKLLYKGRATFSIEQIKPNWVLAKLILPQEPNR